MKVSATELPEVLLIQTQVFADARGDFMELWRDSTYEAAGIPGPFVQDNLSRSSRGTLRGLHFQEPRGQGKLIQTIEGHILDVAVDVRRGSPTFGRWVAVELGRSTGRQLYVPPGFAHGFCVISETALVAYKCTDYYVPECEQVIAWNDPALGIAWPTPEPTLSKRDAAAPPLVQARVLPEWSPRLHPPHL